jgi:hypothetical protein
MSLPKNTIKGRYLLEVKDWQDDPLIKITGANYEFSKLKSGDVDQSGRWQSFHVATRVKLDGADFFCRQALDTASMPGDLGLPSLSHGQTEWYLDAFFFELISAYDTLLQELNIVYAHLGLTPGDVHWGKIKDKLPPELRKYMEEERKKQWFDRARKYRNTATHHSLLEGASIPSIGKAFIYYRDKEGKFKGGEEIAVCKDYLSNMVNYISSVWEMMAQEFE